MDLKVNEEAMNRSHGDQNNAPVASNQKQAALPQPRSAEAAPQVQIVDGKIIINQQTLVVEVKPRSDCR